MSWQGLRWMRYGSIAFSAFNSGLAHTHTHILTVVLHMHSRAIPSESKGVQQGLNLVYFSRRTFAYAGLEANGRQ